MGPPPVIPRLVAGSAGLRAFLNGLPSKTLPTGSRANARFVARLAERAAGELLQAEAELIPDVAEASGFSPTEAARALRGALEPLKAEALMAIWEEEVAPTASRRAFPRLVVVFAGGVIPQPNVQAAVAAAMVAGAVLVRPARGDALTPRLLTRMRELALAGGGDRRPRRWLCASWAREDAELTRRALGLADAFVLFGTEESAAALSVHLAPKTARFIYGPRLSLAVLDLRRLSGRTNLSAWAAATAEDVVAYDQRGCLSPAALYLIGDRPRDRKHAIRSLAEALSRRAAAHGFARRIPAGIAAAVHGLRDIYKMDPARKRSAIHSDAIPGWTLLIDEAEADLTPTPAFQTLFIRPVAGWEQLVEALRPFDQRLQAVAIAPGVEACPAPVRRRLTAMGVSRFCAAGRLQSPPLAWRHDGHPFFPLAGGQPQSQKANDHEEEFDKLNGFA